MVGVGRASAAAADALIQTSLLGDVLEQAEVAAFVIGEEGCVACNLEACRLTGYSREELLELRGGELTSRPTFECIVAAKRKRGRVTIRRKDGSRMRIEFRASRTAIAGMPFMLCLAWPATD